MLNHTEYNELIDTTDCINALCEQKPMMVINTQCGTGKYRFKKVGYKDGGLLMEFTLIHDAEFKDTENIYHKIQPERASEKNYPNNFLYEINKLI